MISTIRRKIGGALARLGIRPAHKSAAPPEAPREFDPQTLPWIDRADADISAYVASLGESAPKEYDLGAQLEHWRRFGFAVFPQLIPQVLVDAYRDDVAELIAQGARFSPAICRHRRHGVAVGAWKWRAG
ncbi:MAG: hypothetical protein ABI624_07925 [Casimicrobiaceae bacterium]